MAKGFDDWNFLEFLKGRKRLLVAAIGFVASYLLTSNPALSGIVAAGSEMAYALISYYLKE